jgi:hypothetical protein
MNWREEKRRDTAVAAEQARQDKLTEAQAKVLLLAASGDQQQRIEQARREQARQARVDRQAASDQRRDRRDARRAALRTWAAGHAVDLLIYPLALVSAVMAVPAMAGWGVQQYESPTGALLPAVSELGMWAFAIAVQLSRHRYPDRSVWALQLGVAVFAAANVGLNFLHGEGRSWVTGLVMGVVSVAGVMAHQLVTTGARRSRADRDAARTAARIRRRVRRYERAALRRAVARIDTAGTVSLIVSPGVYTLAGRGRLDRASVPGLPVASIEDEVDRELAALLAGSSPTGSSPDRPATTHPDTPSIGGPISTMDRGREQEKSSPDQPADPVGEQPVIEGRKGRSIEQLRTELHAAIEADPHGIDPHSAESIRRALRCSPRFARQLRDEWRG